MMTNDKISERTVKLLKEVHAWFATYNIEYDNTSARQIQSSIADEIDIIEGKKSWPSFTCQTCGSETREPEILCEQCILQDDIE
jgi:hypothetical protein